MPEELGNTLADMHIAGDWLFEVYAILGGKIHFNAEKLNYHRRHSASVIGKTLSENKLREFFKEFYIVQSYIFENYNLLPGFENRWEAYLRSLWHDLAPNRIFEELAAYYPFEEAKNKITSRI